MQVETYLRSEGVLVRFWYPLEMLEKPQPGLRKSSITGGQTMDTSNVHIHRSVQLSWLVDSLQADLSSHESSVRLLSIPLFISL